jgi:hypothetical protein
LNRKQKIMNKSVIDSLLMGAGCSIVGLICGLYISNTTTNLDYSLFWLYASIAAFLTAGALWWILIEKATPNSMIRGPGWMRGGIVGGLAGFVAHIVCWIIVLRPTSPAALTSVFVFSLFSVPIFGLFTIPAGMVVGGVMGRWRIERL